MNESANLLQAILGGAWTLLTMILGSGISAQVIAHWLARRAAKSDAEKADREGKSHHNVDMQAAMAEVNDRGTARVLDILYRSLQDCEKKHAECERREDLNARHIVVLREALIRAGHAVPEFGAD